MEIKKIEEAFIREGYVSVPFALNGVGHPMLKVTLADVEASFLLDTGAAINLMDYEFAKRLNLSLTPTGEKGAGAGGIAYEIFSMGETLLNVSGQQIRFDSFYSMDFSSIKEALSSRGVLEEIQGILGFSFFQMTKCFIDYSDNRIFILNR